MSRLFECSCPQCTLHDKLDSAINHGAPRPHGGRPQKDKTSQRSYDNVADLKPLNTGTIFENLIAKEQLAGKLGISPSYVNKLMVQGLPRINIGRAVRFRFSEVVVWLERNMQ